MANGYSIFLLKGFFDSLPQELFEVIDIDGASEWQKFWMITMVIQADSCSDRAGSLQWGMLISCMHSFCVRIKTCGR